MVNVNVGDVVENERYNDLRSRINAIYVDQWNQSDRTVDMVGGSTPGVSDKIARTEMLNLYLDIQGTRVHQTGSLATLAVPSTGYVIGADTVTGFNQTTYQDIAVSGGTSMGNNDFENRIIDAENYNFTHLSYPAGNFSPGTARSSSRTPTWGVASNQIGIYHVVRFQWASVQAKTYYRNAGGRIAFTTAVSNIGTGASQAKNQDWADLLSAMGTVTIDAHNTSAASGTSANRGFDDLTNSYQVLFTKTGSGAYNDNYYELAAKNVNSRTVDFRITFYDGDTGTGDLGGPGTGTPIDEPVTADFTSTATPLYPDSTFVYASTTYTACSLPQPTSSNQTLLTADLTNAPT